MVRFLIGTPAISRPLSASARSASSLFANVTKQKGRRLSVFLCLQWSRGKRASETGGMHACGGSDAQEAAVTSAEPRHFFCSHQHAMGPQAHRGK